MKRNNIPLNDMEKSHSKISLICSVITLIILTLLIGQLDRIFIKDPKQEEQKKQVQEQQKSQESQTKVYTSNVIAVGDNLYHTKLYESGQSDSGTWNYDHIYEQVKDEIQAADLAIVDQETVFTDDHTAVSGYPSFATPTEVGDALVNAGFDVIEAATNHIDDYGTEFIQQTLNFWSTSHPNIPVLGIHSSQEDADTVKIVTSNNINIAFLDYTYGTNNGLAGEGTDSPYMVDIFNKEKVTQMIAKAKESSDCIIFIAHWGKEDSTIPNEYQKQWATFLMEQGVDVVIGGHPHVLQPYGTLKDDKGNEMLIYYSLGNFVSTQEAMDELLGGMAKFTIEKTVENGEASTRIINKSIEPLIMHYNTDAKEFSPYFLKDYTDELASQHSIKNMITEEFSVKSLNERFDEIMSQTVTPSSGTDLLEARFTNDGDIVDSDGNLIDLNSYTSDTSGSSDSDDSSDSSEDNSSYDDSDDGSSDGYDYSDDGSSDSYDYSDDGSSDSYDYSDDGSSDSYDYSDDENSGEYE